MRVLMRAPIAFLVLAVGAGVVMAIGCSGPQDHVDPWVPPMPSCSCAEPVASASCAPAPSASASAAPSGSTSAAVPSPTEKRLLDGVVSGPTGKPVGNAVVYLEDAPIVSGRGESAMVDQRNMTFMPFVVVVAAGGSVTFVNNDPFPHNVFIRDNGERFDSGMVSSKSSRAHAFKNAGAYKVLCNLHPNMLAYVVVSPSSYFAVTNGAGKFSIKDVPEGTWKVTTWANGLAQDSQPVKVIGGDVTFNPALHGK